MVVEHLRTFPAAIAGGGDIERVIDQVWFYNDPAHYGALVLRCGGEDHTFQQWLAARMREVALSPP